MQRSTRVFVRTMEMTIGSSRKQSTIFEFTAIRKLETKNLAVWHSVAKLCVSCHGYFIVKGQYHVNCASIFIDTFATSLSNYNQRFVLNPWTAMLRFLSWRHIWWDVLICRELQHEPFFNCALILFSCFPYCAQNVRISCHKLQQEVSWGPCDDPSSFFEQLFVEKSLFMSYVELCCFPARFLWYVSGFTTGVFCRTLGNWEQLGHSAMQLDAFEGRSGCEGMR